VKTASATSSSACPFLRGSRAACHSSGSEAARGNTSTPSLAMAWLRPKATRSGAGQASENGSLPSMIEKATW